MPVKKTKNPARKIELEICDSSDDEGGTTAAENLDDKVRKAVLKRSRQIWKIVFQDLILMLFFTLSLKILDCSSPLGSYGKNP